MTLASQIASGLFDIRAVYLRPDSLFTWAPGIKSSVYTDGRVTLSYPETRTLIENGFVEKIKEEFPEVEVIAGTAIAGIPHGATIADKMNLPFTYARSKSRDHGASNQAEDHVTKDQEVVVAEDLISTGGSVLEAIAAAEREGAGVIGVMAISAYELPKVTENFEKAGIRLVAFSDYTELTKVVKVQSYIIADDLQLLHKFRENQETRHD